MKFEKEKMKSTVGTMLDFENTFGKSYSEVVTEITSRMIDAQKSNDPMEVYKVKADTIIDVLRIYYSMAKEETPFEKWADEIDNVTSEEYMEILTMAQKVFQG